MEIGLLLEGKDLFYDAMHIYGFKNYFGKTGASITAYMPAGKDEEKSFSGKRFFSKKPVRRMSDEVKKEYLDFIKEQAGEIREYTSAKPYNEFEYTFGTLIIPKKDKADVLEAFEDNIDESFVPAGFLINNGLYRRLAEAAKKKEISAPVSEKYLFCFIEKETFKKAEYVINVAKSRELKLVCMNAENKKWYSDAEFVEDKGPYDRIAAIDNAELIITDSLSVLEMAVIFRKKFMYVSGSYGEGKAALLLEQLGMTNHFVYDASAIDDYVETDIPKEQTIEKILEGIRKNMADKCSTIFPSIDSVRLAPVDCPANIKKSSCYGCHACKEICPKGAITMQEDAEGFLYPVTDYLKCVSCGLCAKVCPGNSVSYVEHEKEDNKPYAVALYNKDKEMLCGGSSSGAVFPELVKYVLEEKQGAVVGVRYDENMMPVSDIAFDYEEAKKFFGSKYAKSNIDGIFPRVKKLLDEGRYVLYSGLGCECAGLRKYLRKEYDNLFVCEILCHSVPSPKVYRRYLDYLEKKKKSRLTSVTFRNKDDQWQKMVYKFENGTEIKALYWKNNYFRAFSKDIITRKSCSECKFIFDHRTGDITIGDFWGVARVAPEFENPKGTSIMLVNTEKGEAVLNSIKKHFETMDITMDQAFIKNHKTHNPIPPERKEFFTRFRKKENINELLAEYNDFLKPKTED